jgi:hypothetical protein
MAISESDLILPTLELLDEDPYAGRGASVTELIPRLRLALKPEGHDAEAMPNRADDYFSQKVRNLMCHRTLEKRGLASFVAGDGSGRLRITDKGREMLRLARRAPRRDGQFALPLHP